MPITNAASVFIISLIVAYGITFHKILTVSALLRKATAYALLMAYLSTIYYVAWITINKISTVSGITSPHASHLISTILVVFSISPARHRLEKATEHLFRNSNAFNIQETMKKAGDIFQSVTTINALLQQFSELLRESINQC